MTGSKHPIDNDPVELTDDQGKRLVALARRTIEESLGVGGAGAGDDLAEPVFREKRGVFVTLHSRGKLRGCIGSLTGRETIVEGVRDHAINAAFHDHRFNPVAVGELDDIDIEVSILTEPQTLDYDGSDDLLALLEPGRDGVIIRRGGLSATFLPQVWDQLPAPVNFLSQLCLKAGMPAGEWRQGRLEVQTYRVAHYGEVDR